MSAGRISGADLRDSTRRPAACDPAGVAWARRLGLRGTMIDRPPLRNAPEGKAAPARARTAA